MAYPSRTDYLLKCLKDIILGDDDVIQTGPVVPRLNKSTGKIVGSQALQLEGQATVALISFGDVRLDGSIDYPMTPTVAYSPEVQDYVVRPGDILFRGRGYAGAKQSGVAAYIQREEHDDALRQLKGVLPQVCYAYNSSVQRIRLGAHATQLDPEYLAAYINSPVGQRYLFKHNQGMVVTTVSKTDLMNMPIALPPLSEQRKIVELIRTKAEYARHAAQLLERYDTLINQVFNQA
jgi:Type I restriction modification DNA specificity domain